MSVLDEIKQVEAKAQQDKAEALRQAREAAAKAQSEAGEKAREILEEARRQAGELLAEARFRMAEESRKALAGGREADEAAASLAEKNLPRAVAFLAERIEKQ